MRFVAAKITNCPAGNADHCPCRLQTESSGGTNTKHKCGTAGGPVLSDATSLCELSCANGTGIGTGYWPFFVGPQSATTGLVDYCGGRWNDWLGGTGGILGRGKHFTSYNVLSTQNGCLTTSKDTGTPYTYGEGVMCCK
jgi:hypothetical protein